MKKLSVFIVCSLINTISFATTQVTFVGNKNDGLDYLRNEISVLEKQLAQKTDTLNKCAEKNKNFKIAGIATVGLAGAGVVTNVSLYSEMENQKKQAESMNNKIKTANVKWLEFQDEMEKVAKNLDPDKFFVECQKEHITEADILRLQDLEDNDLDNLSESDKIMMEKILRAARNSQKQ